MVWFTLNANDAAGHREVTSRLARGGLALTDCRWWFESLLVHSGVKCDPPKGNGPTKKRGWLEVVTLRAASGHVEVALVSA